MHKLNYDNAIQITRDIYWIGFYDKEASLHCNPYLIIDDEEVILIDSGSIPHFPVIMRKILDIVDPGKITTIIAQHQDPDVCGNLMVVEDLINNPELKIVAHSNTIRLIRHYGLTSPFYAVDDYNYELKLKSGRKLAFIFTPYLHSPGAITTYDLVTRSLFTSDIFAAIDKDWSLFVNGDFLTPMDIYHQKYMPSNQVLKNCMERLETMDIKRILPQHGSVLEGDEVYQAIQHLKQLPCGVDLL